MSTDRLPNRLVDRIPAWALRGLCRQVPELEWFVDEYAETVDPAVAAVCTRCPVRGECLTWALDRPEETEEAVYGGLSPVQRRRLLVERTRGVCPGCGSPEVETEDRTGLCLACGVSWKV